MAAFALGLHRPAGSAGAGPLLPTGLCTAAAPLALQRAADASLFCVAGLAAGALLVVPGRRRRLGRGAGRGSRGGKRSAVVCGAAATGELTQRQKQFWETLDQYFEVQCEPELGEENLDRMYQFMKYTRQEVAIPELPENQEIFPEYFPGLRAKPWWEPSECGDWVEKVIQGLPYVQGELADLLEEDEASFIGDSVQSKVMGGGWSGFRLQRLGTWLPKNCDRFPQTVQLLKEAGVPLAMRGVVLARQMPGTHVAPHSDGRNVFLTAHFGLSIPSDCDITCGGETRNWVEDGAIILDTSFQHSVSNRSDEDRFVLIVDFWHPDLTWEEKEALEYFYDFRNKFEQGKISYRPKMPTDFFSYMDKMSPWGGAYTETDETGLNPTLSDERLGW